MKRAILIIDGGTTNTRFTLLQDHAVLARKTVRIGAANANALHKNQGLRDAVSAVFSEMNAIAEISRICISGMITSESGLHAIPHLPAPAGIRELAKGIQTISLPDVVPVPIVCIPGIRTCTENGLRDMMRGEETELMGDLTDHPPIGRRLYIHFGSHNKAILTENGRITRSVTTMSGELLSAAMQHTILASSVGSIQTEKIDAEYARLGFDTAGKLGLTGAFFGARLSAVLDGAAPAQVQSFLYGVLTQQDSVCFLDMLSTQPEEIVFYGRDQFIETWKICLADRSKSTAIRVISYQDSEMLSLHGVRAILNMHQSEIGVNS